MHPEFERIAPPGSTGIKIVIVGAGYGGLACAIECTRKGHEVIVLEKVKELKIQGSLGPNASRILARWGLHDRLWSICGHHHGLTLHNYLGEQIRYQEFELPSFGAYPYNGHRAEIHQVLYEYAESLGVQIKLGEEVETYWEDAERGVSGVTTTNGEVYEADLVVASDGVRSPARKYVLGYTDTPRPSGYAVYRAWFDAAEQGIDNDPLTSFFCVNGDVLYGWIGQDVHMLTASSKNGKSISWVITHRDDTPLQDQWSFPGEMADVLKIVEGWDPRCAAVLSKAPTCTDWKLIIHDPLPTWISKVSRTMLIGDAAHPFLPTSIQGASQAIEDGVTLAVALQLAGKQSVPLAVRTWEHIRYQRVRDAQLMGESTRDKWHQAKPDDRGEHLDLPRPAWLFGFDAEAHAYSVYGDVAKKMEEEGYQLPVLS
ncbi:hypothetical protein HYDPIDRAFT_175598 [Hydnomerulius pinastri MD-312]|uniref:FAD-binding domain-containing protein n=1 Tax=Hydnomerulius pinastri MD-312 TaxID=994086 RepID=A0A0C9WEU0_9AGAM|nr:hypothetical protein HYDPIDRAFT_175598 [Hydnomerulius pinastri MD-312]